MVMVLFWEREIPEQVRRLYMVIVLKKYIYIYIYIFNGEGQPAD